MVGYESLDEELGVLIESLKAGYLGNEPRAREIASKLELDISPIEFALRNGARIAYKIAVSNVLNLPESQEAREEVICLLRRFSFLDLNKLTQAIEEGPGRSARINEENRCYFESLRVINRLDRD